MVACASEDDSDEAAQPDGPITLDYWAWGTSQDGLVEAWNSAHPDVQVRRTDAGGPSDSSAKLVTSSRADEAPDVALVEYQSLPAMIVADVAMDITDHVGDLSDSFNEGVWSQVTFNDQVYGVPQDVGPMALIYNAARFDELGVDLPTTWEEYAQAAADVRAADPDAYISTFAPDQFGWFAGLARQAGSVWWEVDGETWTVNIDDATSREVAEYWQNLADEDLVDTGPILTPEWNAELNDGNVLAWPAALWAPGVIHGVAPDQAGDWRLAPLPQWEDGNPNVAFQGGSAVVVTTSAEYPEQAAEFAAWINSSQEGAEVQIETGQYPASLLGQEATLQSDPPELMQGQDEYWEIAAEIASSTVDEISWGPNVNVADSAFQDAFNSAVTDGTPLVDALAETQQVVVDDMRETGFSLSNE
ncbi:extracellular solute-binding protein [Phytoactinopolyspora halotolerans]|uniref:Extracellular solute-binding protein n=2 Tax=Phytoactinopolyspora halotolerans TaxID=1981512 RepID=A0A6L9S9Q9_9ACTN|nr:extracellular solute-binding protein [Phytoactinopolyspora halotolerans]